MADEFASVAVRRRPKAIPIGWATCVLLLLVVVVLVLVAAIGGLDYSVAFSAAAFALAAVLLVVALYNLLADRLRLPHLTGGWPRRLVRFLQPLQGWLVPCVFLLGLLLGHFVWH